MTHDSNVSYSMLKDSVKLLQKRIRNREKENIHTNRSIAQNLPILFRTNRKTNECDDRCS